MSFSKRLLSGAAPALVPGENFKVVQYTGNGSSQSITGVGFQPDFVWHKRLNNSGDHNLSDSTRGVKKGLNINDPRAEGDQHPLGVTSFDSDGFTVNDNSGGGAGVNGSGSTYVAWCWKGGGGATSNSDGSITSTVNANKAAGFSIVKYTGSGSSASVGHGLGSDPKLIVNKRIASSNDWLAGAITWTNYLEPNGTPPFRTANVWTDTQPTSTTFGVINSTGASGVEYINYCWADVEGYQKISSYEGNGSTNGPIVDVGFEPAYVMVKNVDGTDNWLVFDNARNTVNPRTNLIQWNLGAAQSTEAGAQMNFYSNGFQSVGTGGGGGSGQINSNGDTYLYLAIAADPDTEAPTVASSFGIRTYTGNGGTQSITGLGFQPNFVWIKSRTSTHFHNIINNVLGPSYVQYTNSSSAGETNANILTSFDTNGFSVGTDGSANANSQNFVAWAWKADDNEPTINDTGSIDSIVSANASAGFSISKFTGTGANATVGHGLSASPEFVIINNTSASGSWLTWHKDYGGGDKYIYLDSTNHVLSQSQFFNSTVPTSSVFSIGSHGDINGSGNTVVAYCFHSVTGYSKVGSYTGTAAVNNVITTGFKPDFVLIKKYSGSGTWRIFDSIRGTDKSIRPYDNSVEYDDSANYLDFESTGFAFRTGNTGITNSDLNENNSTFIYLAFKINSIQLDYLVIAGGGGGGNGRAGGGGAGGYIYEAGSYITGGTVYTITVGAGGAAGASGSNSVFGSVTAIGGGRGGSTDGTGSAAVGGSGGGGAGLGTTTEAGAAGTSGQGNAGGHGYYTGATQRNGGGGGGAGGAGGNASTNTSGGGAGGSASSITGSSVTRAGGGGGGDQLSGEGTGGSGGGGNGGRDTSINATAGAANTGSGGGGGGGTGGAGGSGIVILRLLTSDYTGTTTGSPGVTTDGDYTVLQYTSDGTYTA